VHSTLKVALAVACIGLAFSAPNAPLAYGQQAKLSPDPASAVELGARGNVSGAARVSDTIGAYFSDQDGHAILPYRVWTEAPVAKDGSRAQVLATDARLEVHFGYGQSWRTSPMNDAVAPFTTTGEGYAAYTFQDAFGAPLQYIGTSNQVEIIRGFTGIGPGVGQSIDSVATESLVRIRRDLRKRSGGVLNWSAAYPGYRWDQLRPGSEPWAALVGYVAATKTYSAKYGLTPWFRAVGITQGAAESTADTVDAGLELGLMLAELDALDVNGGGDLLQFFIDVTPAMAGNITPYPQSWQQIAFARTNANGRTWLVGPRYQYPYKDDIHHSADGYARIGEQEAWSKHVVLDRKLPWEPLWATYTGDDPDVTVSGNTATIQVNSPIGAVGGVVRDTATIGAAANDGLVVKMGGVARAITAVTLNANSIIITFAGAAVVGGADCEVSYAAYGAGSVAGQHSGVWGNLKKVGPASRFYPSETVDFWLVPFKVLVVAS